MSNLLIFSFKTIIRCELWCELWCECEYFITTRLDWYTYLNWLVRLFLTRFRVGSKKRMWPRNAILVSFLWTVGAYCCAIMMTNLESKSYNADMNWIMPKRLTLILYVPSFWIYIFLIKVACIQKKMLSDLLSPFMPTCSHRVQVKAFQWFFLLGNVLDIFHHGCWQVGKRA